ncbi:hypothetical protein KI387_018123 [Taxus chinensis]|uniref:Diacylglycerol kinase n=1 Tax=Taxus chinensis TaxID=29808 RepID=A0AA38GH99_TAXCH|nr:hypothetical protein KI387_018123 [Taxus chinensis]
MDLKNNETELIEKMRIPDYYLGAGGMPVEDETKAPTCPVLVFINSKSGGQLGVQLLTTYRGLLNPFQIYDLGEKKPDQELHNLLGHLERLKAQNDVFAATLRENLRIIVAGGDGTAGWLLGVISDLKLENSLPVATVPLGTGNNLPFSFGWGKKNPGTDRGSAKKFLVRVMNARPMKVDSWHVVMRMQIPAEGPLDPLPPLELPHSLHAFKRVSQSDELNEGAYAMIGFSQGWFFANLKHPSSRNILELTKVKVINRQGSWDELSIPRSIRSIVCLNLPSFSGGLNPWGTPNDKKSRERGLTPPYVDDGLIEVVGFRDAWHGLALLTPNGHGTRLAQSRGIRFEFHKGATDHTFMRMDGEPWKQPLPTNDDTVTVEISHLGQVTMLVTENCIAKSVHDANNLVTEEEAEEVEAGNQDEDEDEIELRRKFGAAHTFKIDVDNID